MQCCHDGTAKKPSTIDGVTLTPATGVSTDSLGPVNLSLSVPEEIDLNIVDLFFSTIFAKDPLTLPDREYLKDIDFNHDPGNPIIRSYSDLCIDPDDESIGHWEYHYQGSHCVRWKRWRSLVL